MIYDIDDIYMIYICTLYIVCMYVVCVIQYYNTV